MQFLLLFVFGLICWQNAQSQPSPDSLWPAAPAGFTPFDCALLAWGAVLLAWLAADVIVRVFCRRMAHAFARRGAVLQAFGRARKGYTLGLLGGFLSLLYAGGWGRLVEDDWAVRLGLPGAELIMISPLLAALFLSWERFYRLEMTAFEGGAFGERFLGKWDYLVLQLRNNLLIVVPPACLWLVQQTIELWLPISDAERPYLVVLYFGMLGLSLLSLPLLLRVFLGLRPLPAGPLRARLEATARRLHFRCGDILFWDTHQTMANALITGFLPWPRYVILTDRLIEELTPDELEAVFGHEIGHVRYHHMALYVLFCLASLVLLGTAGGYLKDLAQPQLEPYLKAWEATPFSIVTGANVLSLCGVGLYFFFVFGPLSRTCESQADLFGSRATSSQAFIGALEKVAQLNGMSRAHASWRHPSIAQRIAFVQRASADPGLESRFHLALRLFKWGLAVSLPCLLGAVWWLVGPEKVWELMNAL
jgi:STE24 endopeptidase